jgi:hypothetical protein
LSNNHGMTYSSIALDYGVLRIPDLASSIRLCSRKPARYPLEIILAFIF